MVWVSLLEANVFTFEMMEKMNTRAKRQTQEISVVRILYVATALQMNAYI